MSGENQQWDQGPMHYQPKHEAPKPSREFHEWRSAERKRITVKILVAILILFCGIAWYFGWRPF